MSSQQRNACNDGDLGDADHLAESRPGDPELGRVLALVRHLRRHCPWDARQTPRTLVPYLLEEADETADAILRGDPEGLSDELGDLLLNVAFQVVLAEEQERFTARDVLARLEEKMRVRHPHVYGDAEAPPDWEETKGHTAGDGTEDPSGAGGRDSPSTPLGDAFRTQDRASRVGFDWTEARGALEKLREETEEVEALLPDGDEEALHEEVGDLLFSAVNVARLADVDPEAALREATGKFRTRFRRLLRLAEARGMDPMDAELDALEALWREIKESGG